MTEIRRTREPIDTQVTPQPAESMTAAQRAALEGLAADVGANRAGAVLLAGAAGAAATRAAEMLASSLGVQVVRLDLQAVTSRYIGETEKNIDAVFRDAERAGAVLLIDEADALFGARTGVKDSHDRYANLDTSGLLARIEAYRGLALLATNQPASIDPQRTRRLRRVIDYTAQ